jgi:hypothetical protein
VQARARDAHLRCAYGISTDVYDQMCSDQNNACAICGRPCRTGKRLAVDHDHETEKVRGLLCISCNVHLGWYENNVEAVQEYLLHVSRYEYDN